MARFISVVHGLVWGRKVIRQAGSRLHFNGNAFGHPLVLQNPSIKIGCRLIRPANW
jgi:hypothetical protein